MESVSSTRKGTKLVCDGFVFVKSKNLSSGAISYECELRRNSKQCKARIHVVDGDIVKRINEHTHAADIGRPEALKVRQSIKRRAAENEETAQQIITQELRGCSEQAAVKLPAINTIRRGIRRYRQVLGNPPAIPQNRGDIVLPERYTQTEANEPFLMFDSGPDDDRILMFSTNGNLRTLQEANDWFCDGTFKVVPTVFFQLFTIHALINNHMIPCVYALLPNKQSATYVKLLRKLRELNPQLQPLTVMIDFELASRNALAEVFPGATIQGCFYHLSQAVYRKVQSVGLQNGYQNDANLSLHIRMLTALAFVPVDDVLDYFEVLTDAMPQEAEPIVDYFEDTYIGRRVRRGRRQPLIPLAFWNVTDRLEGGLPRTNNHVEGWHRRMQANVGACHPSIWHFLDVLRREQSLNEVVMHQTLAGHVAPRQRPRNQAITKRLLVIAAEYDRRPVLEYLRGIAHNIQF